MTLNASDADVTRAEPRVETPAPPLGIGDAYAGRYRVIELLGRGGMGEVYRVHDTVLDVGVALKRVIGGTRADRAQIIHEVKLARQITHRSVCRVFDVGASDGDFYYTMELVQGEDLGALLHRIGRLPPDKVLDIARQSAAGLAAAHELGILHRDLKPGNIMVDRRGDVRITDFGIAAQGNPETAPLAGTPAYMAPEQRRGLPASPQSDLYALGLVLYELLTGRRPFAKDGPPDARAEPPSATVADIDPAFERAVLHTLDPDPAARPMSALAFSSELPGASLLRAALAAGQTPSPNLVAAAAEETLPLATGLGVLGAALVAAGIIVFTASQTRLVDRVEIPDEPAVLAATARAFVQQATGEPTGAHSAYRLQANAAYLQLIAEHRDREIDSRQLVHLVYREAPSPIVPAFEIAVPGPFDLTFDNPPIAAPGSRGVLFDSTGRLLRFRAAPSARGEPAPTNRVDWSAFFKASRVDLTSVTPDAETRSPLPLGERRWAWRAIDAATSRPVTIMAAEADGLPVAYELREKTDESEPAAGRGAAIFTVLLSVVVLGVVAALARRNISHGRADTRGAMRLAQIQLTAQVAGWLLGASYLPIELEFQRLLVIVSISGLGTLIAVSFYLAFEPIVRRRWPWSLVGWNRLLTRGPGDPLVGRDVLLGAVLSMAGTALYQLMLAVGAGGRGDRPITMAVQTLMGTRHLLSAIVGAVPDALTTSMLIVLLFSILVLVLRRAWAASVVLLVLVCAPSLLQTQPTPIEAVLLVVSVALLVGVFVRFGLLALASYSFFDTVFSRFPLSFASEWRSESAVITLVVLSAILGGAAYVALRPQPRLA